ncbi:Siroheme synthase [Austwickia sp. TVS 96-490-7B]|uniref:uroporphyrinogen-III C-methyltransferase n=1 Tax=Austwickia sp. TVS 96-490-7B TaxID=2830843 RepID=UPI001DD11429|nr:uroporphyrinogen-III C-methyltransferase [Austwickia sp. TVS 96-490-7B]MBW3085974.1 Siroheme synthase [Austwickia sp. TVS 96-490-7B]
MSGSVRLDVADQVVLVIGDGPGLPAQVHALIQAGADVHVCTATPTTSLDDVVQRGLARAVTDPDLSAYDLVLTCRDRTDSATLAGGATGTADGSVIGEVILVGGGPGDPNLLTLAAIQELRAADVVVYDRLAPLSALTEAPESAVLVDVGKIPRGRHTSQERINDILVEHALAGRRVVRFKGGDNFVFGRGGEEALACAAAGIPVRVVPGVSSAIAGPGLAGIPVTHRELTQGVTIVTGHVPPGHQASTVNWRGLAQSGTTLVIMMGVHALPAIAEELLAVGMPAHTPAATIADAALPTMRVVRAPLDGIAQAVAEQGLGAPAVTVVGEVAGLDVLAGIVACPGDNLAETDGVTA